MVFVYEYRTSDNKRHCGEISASCREEAFSLLKEKGVRPGRMHEKPGFVNKLLGHGKRWTLIVLMGIVLSVVVLRLHGLMVANAVLEAEKVELVELGLRVHPVVRCQIYGDPAILVEGTSTGWASVFTNAAERLLAVYARPGVAVPPPQLSIKDAMASFETALATRTEYGDNDTDEIKKLKCIVEGMKEEARRYFASGGNVPGYLRRLHRRQKSEVDYYESSKQMLTDMYRRGGVREKKRVLEIWDARNGVLRSMGIATIPKPTED